MLSTQIHVLPSYFLLTTTTPLHPFHLSTFVTHLYYEPSYTSTHTIPTSTTHHTLPQTHTHNTPKMDKPSSNRDNPAKRRCPNDRESDTLFMSRSPEPTTPKETSNAEEALDGDNDDELASEPDEPVYDESQEPFPAYPAFDPAIRDVRARAEIS